jgi:glutamine amidotransferase
MEVLNKKNLVGVIHEHAKSGRPLIGICLGMQLLFTDSNEHELTRGLDLVPGHVVRFPKDRPVPHMGWNEVVQTRDNVLFTRIANPSDFYFVHSYYAQPNHAEHVTGLTDHHGNFAAAVQNDNIFGTQFHPEKSQDNGLTLLRNFVRLTQK